MAVDMDQASITHRIRRYELLAARAICLFFTSLLSFRFRRVFVFVFYLVFSSCRLDIVNSQLVACTSPA